MKVSRFDKSLIAYLMKKIDDYNVLAQSFRRVRDLLHTHELSDFGLRLLRNWCKDLKIYNTHTFDEIVTLVVGDPSTMDVGRDIIMKKYFVQLTRLHEIHRTFIPLQYLLLFPYAEDGYQDDIPIREAISASHIQKMNRIYLREFIAFRIQYKEIMFGNVVNSRRLFNNSRLIHTR